MNLTVLNIYYIIQDRSLRKSALSVSRPLISIKIIYQRGFTSLRIYALLYCFWVPLMSPSSCTGSYATPLRRLVATISFGFPLQSLAIVQIYSKIGTTYVRSLSSALFSVFSSLCSGKYCKLLFETMPRTVINQSSTTMNAPNNVTSICKILTSGQINLNIDYKWENWLTVTRVCCLCIIRLLPFGLLHCQFINRNTAGSGRAIFLI
jgi:hypothetical protein